MKFIDIFSGDRTERCASILLLVAFFLLVFRGQGVLPSIMADEWHYSLLSRLLPFSQSNDPGFAYLSLYKMTKLCADGYLGGARVLNALFFIAGICLVYRTAQFVLPPVMSLGVMLIVLLAPESIYTIFFMPETMYFFVFWLFIFVAIRSITRGVFSCFEIVMCGIVLALASLVKPHAVFLVACFSIFLLIMRNTSKPISIGRRVFFGLKLVATYLFVKFAIGFLVAGKNGVTIFGTRYSSMAAQNITMDRLSDLILVSGQILFNHLSLMMFVFFVPIFGALKMLASQKGVKSESIDVGHSLALLLLVILIPLIGVTAAFTASVAGTNPYDVAERMHMRYYNFIFPLLVIMAAWMAFHQEQMLSSRGKATATIVCIPLFLLGALHLSGGSVGLQINWVDSPSLMFMVAQKWIQLGLLVLGIGMVGLSLVNLQRAARFYLLLFLPTLFIADSYAIQQMVEARKKPDTYDVAGMVVSGLLAGHANEQVTLFGPDEALLYKTSFFIDRKNTAIRVISPKQSIIDPKLVPAETTQVLVFGGAHMNKPGFKLVIDQDFKLFSYVTTEWTGISSQGVEGDNVSLQ